MTRDVYGKAWDETRGYIPPDSLWQSKPDRSLSDQPASGGAVARILDDEEAALLRYIDDHCQGWDEVKRHAYTVADARLSEVRVIRRKLAEAAPAPSAITVERDEALAELARVKLERDERDAVASFNFEVANAVVDYLIVKGIFAITHEGDDARSAAYNIIDSIAAEVTRLKGELAKAVEVMRPLVNAAYGLSFGIDWNGGNHAIRHGYRQALLDAIPAAHAFLSQSKENSHAE